LGKIPQTPFEKRGLKKEIIENKLAPKPLKAEIVKNQEFLKQADAVIPSLKSIHSIKGRPQVRFYEGKDGIKQVYEDTLTSKETILAFATEITLSVDDVSLMNQIPKGNVTMSTGLQNLINAGFVAQQYVLTEAGQRALDFANRQTLTFKI